MKFSICYYGVISRQSSVLIVGGSCDGSQSSLIAKYIIDKWERVGNLQDTRYFHRSIAKDDRIYVVGGHGTRYEFLYQFFFKLIAIKPVFRELYIHYNYEKYKIELSKEVKLKVTCLLK